MPGRGTSRRAMRGFTIVELLVAIAIIIILLGTIIVVLNKVTKTAQGASTQSLMITIKTGLESFKEDVGYLPPVLEPNRSLFDPEYDDILPENGDYQMNVQNWFSITSLPEYLVGYGEGNQDGYGYTAQDEIPVSGIRHPGNDGVWGARRVSQDAFLNERNPPIDGKRLGPYVELEDDRVLGSTDGTNFYLPGDGGYDADDPKVILDYWGEPIRFYRELYRPGALNVRYRPYDPNEPLPSLADVYLLRPWEIAPGTEVNSLYSDGNGDTFTTRGLRSAEYALFSSGPDKALNANVRRDEDEFNADNIVELGP